jgi:6-phosphofructokinase 1
LFLKDLQDPVTGKIPPRLVDIDSVRVQNILRRVLHFVNPDDYVKAKQYVQDPEAIDFFKILNW